MSRVGGILRYCLRRGIGGESPPHVSPLIVPRTKEKLMLKNEIFSKLHGEKS